MGDHRLYHVFCNYWTCGCCCGLRGVVTGDDLGPTAAHRSAGRISGVMLVVCICTFWSGPPGPAWDIHTGTTYCWWHPVVFARHSGVASTTPDEDREARVRKDIAVFPLATPLIAGPGAIGAAILLMTNTGGDLYQQLAVMASLGVVLLLTLLLLLVSGQVHRLLGVTGMNVVSRIFGVLLTALAVQFVFDGLKESGLFPG